ncbi:DedA family protein [Nocardiopsis halotolerans]|uniref:DedA family protein n=1 Tax=Nocardiopsis halotolerans TaxID=124252 RepID=UPI000365BECB|nr:VTT domain-containing protein [Nocardiopsis halotolerans]
MATTANGDPPDTGSEAARTERDPSDGNDAPLSEEERRRKQKEEEAREALEAIKLWKGKAARQDKALLTFFVVIPLFLLAMTPLKPLLIAEHPVLLEFVTGSNAGIGAAAAFARIGEIPLWLVVVAGVVGKIKFDWLFWWMGRRWGRNFINLVAPGDKAQRFADRAQNMNPWIMRGAIVLSYVPGVPTMLVLVSAGWTGMRLVPLLLWDALGALLLTGVVASVGYAAGQAGVDIVLMVDRYALWFTLGIVFVMAFAPVIKQNRAERKRAKEKEKEEEEARG